MILTATSYLIVISQQEFHFSRAKVNKKINTTPKNEKNFGCFFFTHNKSVKTKVLIFVK